MKQLKKIIVTTLNIIFLLFLLNPGLASGQIDLIEDRNTLNNEIGLTHLQSFYDNNKKTNSVTSLEYIRKFENKSAIIGRVNYADRNAVNGVQFEAESYLVHSPAYYSFAALGIANNVAFPEFKAAYSLNRNFNKGWEGELGYRYLRAEKMDIHSATWGVGKYIGNYWLNLKGYIIDDAGKLHHSYRFTGRYYVNDELDYLTLILSAGTSPDDRSRNFEYSNFGSFLSKSVALGYKKTFRRNLTASIVGAWNNQKISDTDYLNQFDIYFSLSKSF